MLGNIKEILKGAWKPGIEKIQVNVASTRKPRRITLLVAFKDQSKITQTFGEAPPNQTIPTTIRVRGSRKKT